MFTQSGTTHVSRLSSTGVTWNGGYILSETLSGSTFIPKDAYDSTKNIPLSSYVPQKIWRMGPDMLGIDATLNQSIVLSHSGLTASTTYSILRSIDGIHWENLGNSSTDSG